MDSEIKYPTIDDIDIIEMYEEILKGFKFRNTEDNILPEDRLSCLNTIVNSRINRVLELGCQWLVG